ncbi:hypothetical protein BS47DRAFT_1306417, partial [Hydnum rufescens UP504]
LPGFGDSEADGKILPCHEVREDGLMRITSDTVLARFGGWLCVIIDCRFEYEHNGGHIPGSVNLNTDDAMEEYLLSSDKPMASRSGDGMRKTILVFHEFRVKRTPTFAKHLLSKDRSMNGHIYPKIPYPEVCVLEGGYSQYCSCHPEHCIPNGYVRMDDPAYQRAQATDLNDFRRWNRARSFTYGEQRTGSSVTSQEAPTEGTRPVSTDTGAKGKVGLSFAAAKAAFGRRGGERASNGVSDGLSALQEDGDSSCASETDVGDSPCPPSNRTSLTIMGVTKARGRQRAMTTALSNTRR